MLIKNENPNVCGTGGLKVKFAKQIIISELIIFYCMYCDHSEIFSVMHRMLIPDIKIPNMVLTGF